MGTAYSYLFCEEEDDLDNKEWKSITQHVDKTYNYTKYKNHAYYFDKVTYKDILLLID